MSPIREQQSTAYSPNVWINLSQNANIRLWPKSGGGEIPQYGLARVDLK